MFKPYPLRLESCTPCPGSINQKATGHVLLTFFVDVKLYEAQVKLAIYITTIVHKSNNFARTGQSSNVIVFMLILLF